MFIRAIYEICGHRVADFALSWLGCYDEVIEGYEQAHPLTDAERELIVPAYWSWVFMHSATQIQEKLAGDSREISFDWQIK